MKFGIFGSERIRTSSWRLRALRLFFIGFVVLIFFRLFHLQVVNASFYDSLAEGQYDFYKELIAERGTIYVKDFGSDVEYIAATNEPLAFVFADPRRIEDPEYAATQLAQILGWDLSPSGFVEDADGGDDVGEVADLAVEPVEEEVVGGIDDEEILEPSDYELLMARLSKEEDPYEPVAKEVGDKDLQKILDLELSGIHYVLENVRSYPEKNLGGHVFGFVLDRDGSEIGQYGVEGYANDFLGGKNGFIDAQTDPSGSWIGVAARAMESAVDGGDLLLTLDRSVQYHACKMLREGVETYQADGGAVVILEPETGAILAMCSAPDFDPNDFGHVEDIAVYNNRAIFTPYEPGSVFKPLVMAAALDVGAVTPTTVYEDTGVVEVDEYKIRNSDLKAYGMQTMTEVLEKSLNTGMVHVMRLMGRDVLKDYVERFQFGTLTGVELDTELSGTIASLDEYAESYYATASYGQGITVTPLQVTAAYAALANEGVMMEPYIVGEYRYMDWTVDTFIPRPVEQVLASSVATTIGAMLVSVVENGYGDSAGVPGYYIAGKTRTAQVAKRDGRGYEEDATIATFSGFGPVEDPAFAMTVVLDHPKVSPWASDTSAPVFGNIAEYLVRYYQIPPTRQID